MIRFVPFESYLKQFVTPTNSSMIIEMNFFLYLFRRYYKTLSIMISSNKGREICYDLIDNEANYFVYDFRYNYKVLNVTSLILKGTRKKFAKMNNC